MISADPIHWLLAGLTAAGWGAMTFGTIARHRKPIASGVTGDLLIGYASQSGSAEALARAEAAQGGGRVLALDRITTDDLVAARQAHFYISTTGDGDAPDNAAGFLARVMSTEPDLSGLTYALLGFGDRQYPRFCGFAHRVDGWLRACGASPAFPLVELDRDHPTALADWQAQLGLASAAPGPGWRLVSRRQLNPGSPGGPLWHLALEPEGDLPDWEAGDIATITIPGPDGPLRRDYSLASLPASGRAELILREVITDGGVIGRGSHWLSRRLETGGAVTMQIRANPGFRPGDNQGPMLLIGNGSGLAGLLAHLRHRAALPAAGPVWLLHGERSPDHDALMEDELQALLRAGHLTRFERSFSRRQPGPRYVQDLVRMYGEEIRGMIREGGTIWLCGRRDGMARDVLTALDDVLGAGMPAELIRTNRLRRDVY